MSKYIKAPNPANKSVKSNKRFILRICAQVYSRAHVPQRCLLSLCKQPRLAIFGGSTLRGLEAGSGLLV